MEKLKQKRELGIYLNTETKKRYSLKKGFLVDGTSFTFYLFRGKRIVIPKSEYPNKKYIKLRKKGFDYFHDSLDELEPWSYFVDQEHERMMEKDD